MASIRALRPEDDLSSFSSGNVDLDRFLKKYAVRNQFAEHIGTTYLAVGEADRIQGFLTLASCSILAEQMPALRGRKLPLYPLPAMRLARLAVSQDLQGKGIGRLLIRYTFLKALEQAGMAGCTGVLVDAKPASLGFYKKLGFEPCPATEGQAFDHPRSLPMFITIDVLRAALPGRP